MTLRPVVRTGAEPPRTVIGRRVEVFRPIYCTRNVSSASKNEVAPDGNGALLKAHPLNFRARQGLRGDRQAFGHPLEGAGRAPSISVGEGNTTQTPPQSSTFPKLLAIMWSCDGDAV